MFPCHVPSHQQHTHFELNSTRKFQKILTTIIVGNKTPILKPHLRDLNTQARKSSEILWISEQGKIGSGETQMAIPLMNISAIRVFSNPTPLFPLKRWTHHRNWCRCQDGHERRLPHSKGQISLHTLIHPCRMWRNWMTSSTRRLQYSFSTETRWRSSDHQPTKATELSHSAMYQSRFNFGERRSSPPQEIPSTIFPWHWMWIVANCRWDDASSVARKLSFFMFHVLLATWWFNAWDLPFYKMLQPLRRNLVRPRPSWFDWGQNEEPFTKLARTVSVCLSLNTHEVSFSNEPRKN